MMMMMRRRRRRRKGGRCSGGLKRNDRGGWRIKYLSFQVKTFRQR